jgi:metacaspase-1
MNKALLVGINTYPSQPLRGCVNDVQDMANFLVSDCGFAMDDIRLLTDNRATKKGIIQRLEWLLKGIQPADRIVFHYSGHGAQLPTRNPEGEVDNLDEIICPYDFNWTDETSIRDKEFKEIFGRVPEGVLFTWISDSCHSGDLFRFMQEKSDVGYKEFKVMNPPPDIKWRLETAKSKKIKPLTINRAADDTNILLIAGCKSNQLSADAFINNRFNGALTFYLIDTLRRSGNLQIPMTTIIEQLRDQLKSDYDQEPQLEGNSELMGHYFLG